MMSSTGWFKKIATGWHVSFVLLILLITDMFVSCASAGEEASKKIQVPVFSGKSDEFQVWWMRFKAYATLIGFAMAINQTKETDLPDNETESTAEPHTDKNKEAKKRNLTAMYYLTLAFTTDAMMGVIFTSQTAEWPSGLAYLVVAALYNKFRPKDTISRVEMRMKLARLSMKPNEKPSVIFEAISSIKNQFYRTITNDGTKNTIDDEEYLAAAMAAAPDKCKSIVTSVQISKGDAMTLKDLETAMT